MSGLRYPPGDDAKGQINRRCSDQSEVLLVDLCVVVVFDRAHSAYAKGSLQTRFVSQQTIGGCENMKAVVKKWGNSASVRIPAAVMRAAHLNLDERVDVREESGRIVIEPLRYKKYDLAELVNGITPENLHEEIDFGRPVGKETP